MNKLATFKFVTRLVVGAGTSSISRSIIQNNVQPDNVMQKITIAAASVVIGCMASDATKEYTERQIDHAVTAWNNLNSSETQTPTA